MRRQIGSGSRPVRDAVLLALASAAIGAAAAAAAAAQWRLADNPRGYGLQAAELTSARAGIAVGQTVSLRAAILRSTDGGLTFKRVLRLNENTNLADVRVGADGVGYAAGADRTNALLLQTRDRGQTWRRLTLPATIRGLKALAVEGSTILVGGAATVALSEDAGAHWRRISIPSAMTDVAAVGLSSDALVVAGTHYGNDGVIATTTTRGRSWRLQHVSGTAVRFTPLRSLGSTSFSVGYSNAEGAAAIVRSADRGLTWRTSVLKHMRIVSDVWFTGPTAGWVAYQPGVAPASAVATTHDGGRTWKREFLLAGTEPGHLAFRGARGWLLTPHGVFARRY